MSAATAVPAMRLRDDAATLECDDAAVYTDCLPLAGARIIELGCGAAPHARAIAAAYPRSRITAYEVDRIQHEKNLASAAPPNLTFRTGGAETIAEDDATFDLCLMFKSLHHVPVRRMDDALAEIHRVLKPGGLWYCSEPVFAGEFNDILRLFHDEEAVRAAAFAALERAVAGAAFELVEERFFLSPVAFEDFADFEQKIIRATHSRHDLSPEVYAEVRARMARHHDGTGLHFLAPMRADVLRRR